MGGVYHIDWWFDWCRLRLFIGNCGRWVYFDYANYTPSIFAISTLVSVFTGIFFGIIPTIGASRMDPIKAIYN